MPTILQFPKIDKQRNCSECGGLFLPRERFHRMCFRCFKGMRAIEALQTATRLWNELVKGAG
jgi:hypothetical protein